LPHAPLGPLCFPARRRRHARMGPPLTLPGDELRPLDVSGLLIRPDQLLARPAQHVPRLGARLVRADACGFRRWADLRVPLGVLELLGPDQVDVPPPVPWPCGAVPLL